MLSVYSFSQTKKSSKYDSRNIVTNLRGFGMKVKEEYFGKVSKVQMQYNRFGKNGQKEFIEYNGVWVKDLGNTKYLFISKNELDGFTKRAQNKKKLLIPMTKGFWLFKKNIINLGELRIIKNSDKVNFSEVDEYYGLWIEVEKQKVFVLMTIKEYERLLFRASTHERSIPSDSYED